MAEKKSFDELVADAVERVQVAAAAGEQAEYQAAAFQVAVQKGKLARKVRKHFQAEDIASKLDAMEALHAETQARIAADPSKLAVLDKAEYRRQQAAADKAAKAAAKATVEAAPCAEGGNGTAAPAPAKGSKGKGKGATSATA